MPNSSYYQYPNNVSSYNLTHFPSTNVSRWNARIALPDQTRLARRDIITSGQSHLISTSPSNSPIQMSPQPEDDVILAGGTNRNHYINNQRQQQGSWSSFRTRHMHQIHTINEQSLLRRPKGQHTKKNNSSHTESVV